MINETLQLYVGISAGIACNLASAALAYLGYQEYQNAKENKEFEIFLSEIARDVEAIQDEGRAKQEKTKTVKKTKTQRKAKQ